MRDKVGILTFVWSRNYGAKLQAWALQSLVFSLGFECEIISFRRKHDCRIRVILKFLRKGHVGRFTRELAIDLLRWRKHLRLDAFTTQQMRLSPKTCFNLNDLAKLSERYSTIICGSDQVWNPELTLESQLCYLLDIPDRKDMLRIAYAASIGRSFINESMLEDFSRCLKKFDAISLREKSAITLIKSLAEKDISSVLDPTLLLTMEQWTPLCADVDINEPYLLVYSFGSPSRLKKLAEQIAEERGLKIVSFHKKRHYRNEACRVPNAGPREFLGLFSKAQFVITNSFHGTAFSIIFKKAFFCMSTNDKGSRLRDLLDSLDLGDRLVSDRSSKNATLGGEIDYIQVEDKLRILREKSIAYLKSALEITKVSRPSMRSEGSNQL